MHRAHDYEALMRGWKEWAPAHGASCEVFAKFDGYDLYVVKKGSGGSYLSAGIHGDEPAGPWGLWEWASGVGEGHLLNHPFTLFPCLNPWGLERNIRLGASGEDLNRLFHDRAHPLVSAWRSLLKEERFEICICLHEDYDAIGFYGYEISQGASKAEGGFVSCEVHLPREPDGEVEGLPVRKGLVQTEEELSSLDEWTEDVPEAVELFRQFSDHTLTFETPSEEGWSSRIATQVAFLTGVLE
ncbi:MAG: M14 family metallocarboxypeptidase [Verrucomicrobiota bacterium]